MSNEKRIKKDLASLFRARFPYVYINTWEEARVTKILTEVGEDEMLIRHKRLVYTWSQTQGLICSDKTKSKHNVTDPINVLEKIRKCDEDALFILKDFHIYLNEPRLASDYSVIRKMRDVIPALTEGEAIKSVVIIAPILRIPLELQKEITVYDFPLPDVEDIKSNLEQLLETNEVSINDNLKVKISKSAMGLTLEEAGNAFALSLVQNKGIMDESAIHTIFEEKNQVIKKNGILEFVKSDLDIDDIGGLENLKNWLRKRNDSWLDSAKIYNLPAPKGILITGIPGCGKSLTAKAISAIWQLPLLKLDMGKIYSGIVGSSEQNMRRALETAEAVSPSILWIDEIEKGLAGHGSSGDSGTSTRIMGTFLTWMQEKTAPVFVISTANDISGLPPELLRKGRFDEIFFVDLPTKNERKAIFEIHLNKRIKSTSVGDDLNITTELLDNLSVTSEGFVGAEIEQAVISALYEAFFDKRNVRVEDLEKAVRNTVPLSVTQREQIHQLRAWANVRAVSATAKEDLKSYQRDEILLEPDADKDIEDKRGGRLLDF